jgi:RNase adaptor protein for sRNA GlmZ degradation
MSAELIVDVNLVKKTAMHNFSCKGLDSFVLNVDSNGFKTRLFITNNECDLRNDFELSDSSEYYDQELIPRNGLHYYVLEYSWHQYGFPEHVNYKKAK